MRTTSAGRVRTQPYPHRRWHRLRTLVANQSRMWDRTLDDLEPWRQDGPLRWRGNRLDGAVLVDRAGSSIG